MSVRVRAIRTGVVIGIGAPDCQSARKALAPVDGQVGRFELTHLTDFRKTEAMTRHQSHSTAPNRQTGAYD